MAMSSKPKGALGLLIAGAPKSGSGEEAPESEETPGGDAKMRAAEDALAALESGDASALNDALTRHYKACSAEVDTEF